MTEDPSGIKKEINIIPLFHQKYKGWWHKIWFFHPKLKEYIQGRVLTLDLDMVIVDNIDCFDSTDSFRTIEDYIPANGFNSSIMNYRVGQMDHVYNNFNIAYAEQMWGDQVWITQQTKTIANPYPKDWVRSYKWECLKPYFHIPENCKIVLYHGKPDPHETLQHIGEYWC